MDDSVEIIRSNKGGMKIIHRGYMYTVHKKRQSGGIRWRCTQRSLHCKGSISTGQGPPKVNMPHNHIPDPHSVALARCRQFEEFADLTNLMDTECEEGTDALLLQQQLPQQTTPQLQIPTVSESVLQSQPLSPTKLKVTRHQPQTSTPKPSESAVREETPEEVCLRWNSHHFNMQTSFPNLLRKEQYVDVTLAAEGKTLKCHRLILSSCSAYFEEILNGITPSQHPVIFMKDIPFWILKSLCDFMYAGEVHIDQNKLEEMLHVAEALKIKGLGGKTNQPAPPNGEKSDPVNVPTVQEQPQTNVTAKQHVPIQSSTNIEQTTVDPLDLLQTSYLEDSGNPNKQKETKLLLKKTPLKKLRKRRSSQHEMSPPPLFHLRKGTRSRPNVKIPKYYHSEYEETAKKPEESSTDTAPLVQTVIKTEPLDVVDDVTYPNDSPENLQNPLIITPIENTLQTNTSEADGDGNFVKITLSSKYLKENQKLMQQTNDSNQETSPEQHPTNTDAKETTTDETTEETKAVSQGKVAPRKRRGRKRKFRRGKTTTDAESDVSPKKALVETDSSSAATDELSESLKRLESTEGLEITAEMVDTETPPQCDVSEGESEKFSENGLLQIVTPTEEVELKSEEQIDETTTSIEEAPDEPTQTSIEEEEEEEEVKQEQEDTFTSSDEAVATVVINTETSLQLPLDNNTTDLDESDVNSN